MRQLPFCERYDAAADEGQNEVDERRDGEALETLVAERDDVVRAEHEVGSADDGDDGRFLDDRHKFVAKRGKDVADGLRQNDKAHRLAGREAHAARSLSLAVVDGLNARADDLRDVRAAVHAHGDNAGGKTREVGDPRDIGDFHADHVMHFQGPSEIDLSGLRYRGYADALRKHGLPVDSSLVVRCESITREEGFRMMTRCIVQGVVPDALFGFNDQLAIGAMKALKRKGFHIPQEVSVMGFTESQSALVTEPMLSSVAQPLDRMCAGAMRPGFVPIATSWTCQRTSGRKGLAGRDRFRVKSRAFCCKKNGGAEPPLWLG